MGLESSGSQISGMKGCEPLLKWPGGKRALLPYLLPLIPQNYKRYIEPFFGGGALYFQLQPQRAYLSDTNQELINCYRQLRDNPDEVIASLSRMRNSESQYYRIRSLSLHSPIRRAARLIYLTSLSFNGIYRENRLGEFNVPYGYRTYLNPMQPQRIAAISAALRRSRLECLDFEESLKRARQGDLVYLDPPYTVAHGNNGFLRYNSKIFSWEDQVRLARAARALRDLGCSVIMTNACHPSILGLYKGFSQSFIVRSSCVAATPGDRKSVKEVIVTNVA
jgi:DNA adenine methylase